MVADVKSRNQAAQLIRNAWKGLCSSHVATLWPAIYEEAPVRPALNKNTTVCISLSGRPSNHGIKFHNYLYEKHGLDYLYKAMTTTGY